MKRGYQIIVFLELVVILFLGFGIYNNNYLASVAFIPADSVVSSVVSELNSYYEPNPEGGTTVFRPEWLSYTPEIKINKDTLNERFEYEVEKPKGVFRILTVGDSWTYGMFVNTKDNYSEKLEDKLNSGLRCDNIESFEVINLGVPSYDIRYEVERLHLRGEKYRPDLVVWHLIENDFQEINEFLKPRTKRYSEEAKEKLNLESGQSGWRQFSKPPGELEFGIWQRAVEDQLQEFGKEGIYLYQKEAFNKVSDYYSGSLIIYTLPHESRIGEEYRPIIEEFVSLNDNAWLYDSELVLKPNNVLPDYHPNADGHLLIAEDLFRYIKTSFLTQENCR